MGDNRLKPCPFCGGEAKILYNRLRCGNYVSGGTFRVHCKNCGITTEGKKDRNKSIELWNTRVPMQKIVERLEEEYKDAQMEYSEAKYQLMEMSEKDSGYISQNYRKDMNEGMCFAFDDAIEIVKEEGGLNE